MELQAETNRESQPQSQSQSPAKSLPSPLAKFFAPSRIPTLDTVAIRQRLAGLSDRSAAKPPAFHNAVKELAVDFCATLPRIFGSELDRMTLWDRIGSAITTSRAKNPGEDVDGFIQSVCDHIKASMSATLACERFCGVMEDVEKLTPEEAGQWMDYMNAHLVPVLSKAKRKWVEQRDAGKAVDAASEAASESEV